MDRLTYRDSTIWAHAERDCRVFKDTDEYGNKCFSGAVIDKLADYEDAEEQGLLIKLPCKVGTPIWYIRYCEAPSCETCKAYNVSDTCRTEYKAKVFSGEFSLFFLDRFGKSVFLTREEAELALKGGGAE